MWIRRLFVLSVSAIMGCSGMGCYSPVEYSQRKCFATDVEWLTTQVQVQGHDRDDWATQLTLSRGVGSDVVRRVSGKTAADPVFDPSGDFFVVPFHVQEAGYVLRCYSRHDLSSRGSWSIPMDLTTEQGQRVRLRRIDQILPLKQSQQIAICGLGNDRTNAQRGVSLILLNKRDGACRTIFVGAPTGLVGEGVAVGLSVDMLQTIQEQGFHLSGQWHDKATAQSYPFRVRVDASEAKVLGISLVEVDDR